MLHILRITAFAVVVPALLLFWTGNLQAQQWEKLADIPEDLAFPVVTVLNDNIHVIGGGASAGATNVHYRYSPDSNKWRELEPVPYYAQQPAGAANNGKIHYFGGGFPKTGTPVNSHFIYNPDSNSWAQAAKLVPPRAIHYGISVNNQLYSLAGQSVGANQNVEYLCQMYDTAADAWITKGNLPDRSFWYGSHVVTGGKIYRFGGGGYTAPVKTANVYDPSADAWTALPDLPGANHASAGATIGDKIFIAGGYRGSVLSEVWMFDTKTKTYSQSTPLPVARSYHSLVAIDSVLYCVGGNNNADATVGVSLLRIKPPLQPLDVDEVVGNATTLTCQRGRISLRLPDECAGGDHPLTIADVTGKTVFATVFSGGYFSSENSPLLPAGLYIVSVGAGGETLVKKILAGD